MDTEDNTTLLKVSRYDTEQQNHAMGAEPDQPVCQAWLAGTDKDLGSQINMQRQQKLNFSKAFRKNRIDNFSWKRPTMII